MITSLVLFSNIRTVDLPKMNLLATSCHLLGEKSRLVYAEEMAPKTLNGKPSVATKYYIARITSNGIDRQLHHNSEDQTGYIVRLNGQYQSSLLQRHDPQPVGIPDKIWETRDGYSVGQTTAVFSAGSLHWFRAGVVLGKLTDFQYGWPAGEAKSGGSLIAISQRSSSIFWSQLNAGHRAAKPNMVSRSDIVLGSIPDLIEHSANKYLFIGSKLPDYKPTVFCLNTKTGFVTDVSPVPKEIALPLFSRLPLANVLCASNGYCYVLGSEKMAVIRLPEH